MTFVNLSKIEINFIISKANASDPDCFPEGEHLVKKLEKLL